MDTLIHADIFFFVTTIAVVIVGAALTVVLIYLAKILHDVKNVTAEIREETVLFRKDIGELRAEVKREGFKLKSLLGMVTAFARRRTESKKESRSKAKAK